MEWGAKVSRDYSGELETSENGGSASEITVRLRFRSRTVEDEIQEASNEERDPLAEGIDGTLESIRRQIREGASKVEPPSPEGSWSGPLVTDFHPGAGRRPGCRPRRRPLSRPGFPVL